MPNWVREIITPPVFADDEEKTRVNAFLYIVQMLMCVGTVVIGLIDLASGIPETLLFTLFGASFAVVGMWLTRRGYTSLASYLLILVMVTTITGIVLVGNGIHDIGIAFYPLILIAAAFLVKREGLLVATGLVIASLAYVVFGNILGLVQVHPTSKSRPEDFIITSIIMLFTSVAMNFLASAISRSIESARQNSKALKASNEQLRMSELRWESLVDSAPDVILTVSADGTILFANQQILNLPAKLVGRNIEEFILPEEKNRVHEILRRVLSTGKLGTYEGLTYNVKEQLRWFSFRIAPLKEPDGSVKNLIIIATDIHNSKEAAKALMQREEAARLHIEQLTTLNKIGQAISALRDLDSALLVVLEEIQSALPLDVFFVALYEPDSDQIAFPIMYDSGQLTKEETKPFNKKSSIARVIQTRAPLLLNRTAEDMAISNIESSLGDRSKVPGSIIMAPMLVGDQLIGVVSAQSYTVNVYDENHLMILTNAAQQVTTAIQNSWLFDKLQQELGERARAEQEVRQLNTVLEERVRQRTAELEQANRELEAFSYSVSHDLRAPLRTVHGFTRIIMEDFSEQFPPEARHYLERVREGAQQMGALIDDLLAFSRLGRQPIHREKIELNSFVQEIYNEVSEHEDRDRIQFTLQTLPTVEADPKLIKQVFVNLLSNALKFTRHRNTAIVSIGCEELNNETVIFIKDNGAGFDMAYRDKLFGVFQRLHRQDEYEGTGVGLAICQRIVYRHGGRIWADAAVDRGATFYLTIPPKGISPP